MLVALKKITTGSIVIVNLDNIKTIEEVKGGTMVAFAKGEDIHCTTTMEDWDEAHVVLTLF